MHGSRRASSGEKRTEKTSSKRLRQRRRSVIPSHRYRQAGPGRENRTERDTAQLADTSAAIDLALHWTKTEQEKPVVAELHLFRSRNRGAKDFDDFARGIQTGSVRWSWKPFGDFTTSIWTP